MKPVPVFPPVALLPPPSALPPCCEVPLLALAPFVQPGSPLVLAGRAGKDGPL